MGKSARWLGWLPFLLACAPQGSVVSGRRSLRPPFSALLLNGGGTIQTNYLSHVRHLAEMRLTLLAAGVPEDQISILTADGEDPGPDVSIRHFSWAKAASAA